jgi:hypothetical protein
MKEKDGFERTTVYKKNEKDFKRVGLDGTNWIHPALDKAKWRSVLNTAINFGAP